MNGSADLEDLLMEESSEQSCTVHIVSAPRCYQAYRNLRKSQYRITQRYFNALAFCILTIFSINYADLIQCVSLPPSTKRVGRHSKPARYYEGQCK